MLVTNDNLVSVASTLRGRDVLSLDTETTGLFWQLDDHIVSIIIADLDTEYYFNFKEYEDEDAPTISIKNFKEYMNDVLLDKRKLWYLHNAKFDMHMMAREGIFLAGTIHDTMVVERLLNNNAISLSLANVCKTYGLEKSKGVDEWLRANKMYELRQVPGKQKKETVYFWDKVPFSVLMPYGCIDGRITFQKAQSF